MTTTDTTTTAARPWSPTSRDRLIYQWVKFEGRTQGWVAGELSLNQSTVSRIIDRYERWIAHGGPSQNGGLSRDERLRAQHYLTYERNEWILASCMRLATTMEHLSDTSKSTTTHHCSDPSRELEVRTQHSVLDRTCKVCRYLRLAHRVNMDQKKLVQQEDLPALEPLTLDPNEYSTALADARDGSQFDTPFERAPSEPSFQPADSTSPTPPLSPSPPPESTTHHLATHHSPSAPPAAPMHPVHNVTTQELPLTSDAPTTSAKTDASQNSHSPAYAVAPQPPEPTNPLAEILSATLHQPPPPIHLSMPFHIPLTS